MRELSLAAKLHDIGKVGVPEAILNKPAALTHAENLVVRQHPIIGERILRSIIRNRSILAAIRGHHERIDGNGYPDGLKGSKIPLLARVITVADCFDALTSAAPIERRSRPLRHWSCSRRRAEHISNPSLSGPLSS